MSQVQAQARKALSPILTSVIASRIKAIGERMGVVVERSTRSPLLVEGRDFSLGIYDQDGRLIEQTEYIPILGYAAAPAMRHIAEKFKGRVKQGDVILHNDPYTGGNQASDWKVTKPVFHEGEHIAWVVITAHQADVGGAVPGSYNPNATDLWQEALRLTAVKVYDGGVLRDDVWDLIFGNVRLGVVEEDIRAMIGACTVGERELQVLVDRYSVETFKAVVDSMLDSAEAMARQIITRMPDGVYKSQWQVNYDGITPDSTMQIRVEITVKGDQLVFDFAGTDPQTPGYVNAPLAVTLSSVMISFFMLADTEIPHNDGIMRCIEVKVPEGSILNCQYPAASGFGNHLSDQICSAIMLAFSEALPERVTAGWNPLLCSILNGQEDRNDSPFVDILINACKGGGGGTQGADGYDHVGLIASGGALGAQDPEMFELMMPIFIRKFEYLQDSGGAGEWRGGLGVESIFEFKAPSIQASIFGDGDTDESAAPGLNEGMPGSVNLIEFTYPDGDVVIPKSKDLITGLPAGTLYRQLAGGGGGFGNPRVRPAARVAEEVRFGYVSVASAREHYGVVVDDAGIIDQESTDALRGVA
ncbi:hydantoinase B/oxoprolinase family protein [Pseudarthrobacter sp. HLT3-5]|uniref:hydantoinase B/oxoprolinase family protein n=1 Tax=Pseudarthrobacter cellobiosi TaxID=2953654 RepID=UPI00208DF547|nr:hydantoinase B/oxoprolinase family protein [Pseudarthrobacter sp. HLT3-5]MCO4275624.1 hydantoinase B/oxoprolinase family protein [Pseudarthrobacter sp. HLT3-5]